MKTLHFLENDYKCPAADDCIEHGKLALDLVDIDEKHIDNMVVHYSFAHLHDEEKTEILFNQNNILVTYSMYVAGSDSLFMQFIAMAGRNDIKNITYIDTSGRLIEFLNNELTDYKNIVIDAMVGINCNTILSRCGSVFKRIKIQYQDSRDCVRLEPFDINTIF